MYKSVIDGRIFFVTKMFVLSAVSKWLLMVQPTSIRLLKQHAAV